MLNHIFKKTTIINVPVQRLFQWHERKGAVSRLTPPWIDIRLIHHTGGINVRAKVKFILKFFKISFVWKAEHIEYQKNKFFKDMQVKGPFAIWMHSHLFESHKKNQSVMEDKVEFRLPFGISGKIFLSLIQKNLERVFAYRHRILKNDLENQPEPQKKLTILISGASGTLGSVIVPFLQTRGHRVIKLVRKKPVSSNDEVFWDPYNSELILDDIRDIDAVINLNGIDILGSRWTEKQKQKISNSRTLPTSLLAEKIGSLDKKPRVFISSSAIGFYGQGGEKELSEDSDAGNNFISRVCKSWEKASLNARNAGIRTVQIRIGIVLTPAGGALKKMALPFKLGLGARISHGKQYMSWISIDDVTGAINHILFDDSIQGPVNVCAPNPVTNAEFTKELGRIFKRPAFFVIPEFAVKMIWGQMGEETTLASARVCPGKLLKTGYKFRHTTLLQALKHLLGR